MLIAQNGIRQINMREKSTGKMLAVADNLSIAIFRAPRAIKYAGIWQSSKWSTYWCERMVTLGVAEKRVHSRGWYTWTLYRLLKNYGEIADIIGGIPF